MNFPKTGKNTLAKKKLFLDNLEESTFNGSLSCEFTPDGIRFLKTNIKVTQNGTCQVNGDEVMPLSVVSKDDVEYGDQLGKGNSCVVREGVYKPNSIPVAVKTVNAFDKEKRHQVVNDLKNFLADRLQQIGGQNQELSNYVVQVYGAYYDEGKINILMELMDAGTLRDLLDMTKQIKNQAPYIDEPYLANIAYQILLGFEYIHTKKKQIHRDIKPENILVNSVGQVKLSDFGISKQLGFTLDLCKTVVGTALYMSPERMIKDQYAFPCDIWSLGIILLELATGEYPYQKNGTFIGLVQQISDEKVPQLPDNGLYSDLFRDFVSQCLKKEPLERATAYQLLKHPWLAAMSERDLDLSEWICNLLFKHKNPYSFTQPDFNSSFNSKLNNNSGHNNFVQNNQQLGGPSQYSYQQQQNNNDNNYQNFNYLQNDFAHNVKSGSMGLISQESIGEENKDQNNYNFQNQQNSGSIFENIGDQNNQNNYDYNQFTINKSNSGGGGLNNGFNGFNNSGSQNFGSTNNFNGSSYGQQAYYNQNSRDDQDFEPQEYEY